MTLFNRVNGVRGLGRTKLFAFHCIIFFLSVLSFSTKADEKILGLAEAEIKEKNYQKAQALFNQLSDTPGLRTEALFGLARVAFYQDKLDLAEDYILEVIEDSSDNPEYLFIAGRIAGKQAQNASIFTKLGYAKDAKKYFSQALDIDNHHKASLVGLIRFHQQAPSMAGGDKDKLPSLLTRLRKVDKRQAFELEAPELLQKNQQDRVFKLYQEALQAEEGACEFKFNFAMMLVTFELYQQALTEINTIDVSHCEKSPELVSMRLYQIGKLAAESNSQLVLGLQKMTEYKALEKSDRTISDDWIDFRIAQLKFLSGDESVNQKYFKKMAATTRDKDLRKKIRSFMKSSQQRAKR